MIQCGIVGWKNSGKTFFTQKLIEYFSKKKLNELIQELDSPDIVIIEGFKDASHPKIEIIKNNFDNYLFPKIKNVLGLVSDSKIDTNLPQFKRKEIGKIGEFILRAAK